MSAPTLLPDVTVTGDLAILPPMQPTEQRVASDVARRVVSGTSALGAGIMIERGAGFLANILAARFAGTSTFGAYSLAISTANNISTYAAGGIGATATRFSGKYAFGTTGYSTLARALAVVSLVSAGIAAAALWLGAAPIAHLLHKTTLADLLRWAAVSAAGIILLECARGFFVGQRRLTAVLLLSLIVGAGMLLLLPWTAASHHPKSMIITQGLVTITAVAVCLVLSRPLGLMAPATERATLRLAPMLREVWGFGGIQLAGLIGANLSGWWLTALVARSDTTLEQMSFFAISSQLRNLAGLAPGLLTEGSYAVMADPQHEHPRTPHRVMALCSFASTGVSLLLAEVGMLIVPWVLLRLYGSAYRGAALAAAVGLAVAVVHMGNAPAAARLSIVSIRATGVINTMWAMAVAAGATLLLLHGGSASLAMGIFLGAHVLSALLVLLVLAWKDYLPAGMTTLFVLSTCSAVSFVLLSIVRLHVAKANVIVVGGMVVDLVLSMTLLFWLGLQHGWLPTAASMRVLKHRWGDAMHSFKLTLQRRTSHGS